MSDLPTATAAHITLQEDDSQLYGAMRAPVLTALTRALEPHVSSIVDAFYERLMLRPAVNQLIKALSPSQFASVKALRTRNLLLLTSPELTREKHRAAALSFGRIHAIAGMARGDLVRSQDILHAAIRHHLDTKEHVDALSVLALRLIYDLAWQAESYQRIQTLRFKVLSDITRLAWETDNYTDLISKVTQVLGQHDEIAGCSFGRPDDSGTFRFESVSGERIAAYLAELQRSGTTHIVSSHDERQGQGPTGKAWQSGNIEFNPSFTTDPAMAPWKDAALQQQFHSSAAVPLLQPGHSPIAVLTLYSAFPGGFASAEQSAFLSQLQALLVFGITRIEGLEGRTRTVSYTKRQYWRALLCSDALEMHYQPVLKIDSWRIIKVEALARLRDGARQLLPGEFMPALSSEDLLELYSRGLAQALAQRSRWLRDGLDMNIAVNLPTSALGDLRYLHITQQALHEHDCPPHALTLEVLETDQMSTVINAAKELEKFKALGVMLAEDDLGTGHSSLVRLRELPFDTIKIDRRIVQIADGDPSEVLRFIYQLTRLGHSLNKLVIVEGVEDEALLEAVAVLGVDGVQGNVIAPPMPASHVKPWLETGQLPTRSFLQPASTLAKLAQLLVWEEHLYLSLHLYREGIVDVGNRSQASIKQASAQPSLTADPPCVNAETGAQPVPQPYVSPDLLLPFVPLPLHDALVEAATTYGLHSSEYGVVRKKLVDALGAEKS
jgi:EAL domain-containing protein (putative c-di-GMP-specific phosphodiesterase class I)